MLKTPLTKALLRTTDNYIKALEKAGLKTVWDMLTFFPRDYEDRTQVLDTFSLINLKEKNTILVTLLTIENSKTSGNKILTKAIIEDKSGFLAEAVWFNRKYLAGQMERYKGKKVILSGKPKYEYGKISFPSPEIETDLSKIAGSIVPVYSDAQYIPGKWIESKMGNLEKFISEIPENLPEHILKKYNFLKRKEAFYKIHFPKNSHDIELAKYRLAYEELYTINYGAIASKHERFDASEGRSLALPLDAELVKEIMAKLPFELTGGQKIALFQVLKDMEKTHSMQRLLEGDVGTGKTVVALIATIHAILQSEKQHPHSGNSLPTKPHHGISSPSSLSPQSGILSPLEEKGAAVSTRKLELKSPGYVFELAKGFRKNPTQLEEQVWEGIKGNKIKDLKFRRQHPIGRYIADFYNEENNLIIELDGKIHEEKYQKEYDNERNNLLEQYGFQLLRIKNEELESKTKNEIKTYLEEKIVALLSSKGEEIQRGGNVLSEVLCEENSSKEIQRRGNILREVLCEDNNPEKIQRGENSKIQVAIMAPTEILARQHFLSMQNMLFEFGISCELLVGSTTAKKKSEIKALLKSGNLDVIIGTHALVQEDVFFKNLGFVVIDEQHRFGVKQREVLEKAWGNTTEFEYISNIGNEEYEAILKIIEKNVFNTRKLDAKDFVCIKKHGKIVGFVRIYQLEGDNFEISNLWVDESARGDKLGKKLMSFVYKEKYRGGKLFLTCKTSLAAYYQSMGFLKSQNFPERFQETLDWAQENNLDYSVFELSEFKAVRYLPLVPHNLNMTATPIPRTLALTLYGDQDLSIISEYPKGRKIIHTKVAKNDAERRQIELFIRSELEKGRQVFWISPLVEESEKIDLANALSTYESLIDIFSPFQVGLLHGKMKAKEKEQIMGQFKENKIQVLSSTSVVEVGVDVPNATIMCIEGAERFGLSQLHQFRGRVGRGQHQSYCYLFPTTGQSTDRLKAMERTNNGFELSEIDLEIRGPGEVYGVRQSGLPDLKIADITDLQLVSQIREDIEEMFEKKK